MIPMKILAIETSSIACSVALLSHSEIKTDHRIQPMQHAQLILTMINTLLHDADIALNQLDAIAFGCGPGSFTGVRIATSVIQGLGFATDLPIIPVSSLAALAQSAYQDLNWKNLLVVIDARVQEVYTGAYQVNSNGLVELVNPEMICRPEELSVPDKNNWYGVGNAWQVYQNQLLFKPVAIDANRLPSAAAVLELAKVKFQKQEWVRAADALPVYLRDEVVFRKSSNGFL